MHSIRIGTIMVALLAGAGLVLAYQIAGTLLLVFAGILLAVVLDVAMLGLKRILPIGRLALLSVVSSVGFLLLVAVVVWGGMSLISQAHNVVEIATHQAAAIGERLKELGIVTPDKGRQGDESGLQNYLPDPERLFGHAQSAFGLATGILANVVIIIFLGIFFAASPSGYRDGFLKLLPVVKRSRVGQVLAEAGHALRWWLLGQLASMVLVAVSIGLMLFLVGIPNAILLGMLAGLLNFIPFLGPILAAIPVLLAAMPEGLAILALVMGLFVIIESIEGYLVNPIIQKRAVYLPPAWSLAALVIFGALFGGIGVALATPLLAVARILVLRLYVEDVLERQKRLTGPKM